MPYSLSMDLQQKPVQTFKQLQRLIMSRQMQQAIHFLQMPVMELSPLVDVELQQNPVLEYLQEGEVEEQDVENEALEDELKEDVNDNETTPEKELKFDDKDFEILRRLDEDFRDYFFESGGSSIQRTSEQEKLQTYLENSVLAEETLFEHLMRQAQEEFNEEKILSIAEALIGNLDSRGFLMVPLQEIAMLQGYSLEEMEKVLLVIQTFHPSGVGARDLKESLLIQLKSQGKKDTLAYEIINKHFDDLIHNKIPTIKKALHCSAEQIDEMVDQHIAKLDLHPGAQLSHQTVRYIIPDINMRLEDEKLLVFISEESMPRLRLNSRYLRMLEDDNLNQEAKEFIRQKIVSAKWLLRNIMQRNDTLEKIAQLLSKSQREFFINPQGKLVPLTMRAVAEELEMHESTIARAVANKYMDTPRGLLPLRFFFTNALSMEDGVEISSKTVRDILQEIVDAEDKKNPLSDETISLMMKKKGIQCARRTVAKYRSLLNIGSAQQRRKF